MEIGDDRFIIGFLVGFTAQLDPQGGKERWVVFCFGLCEPRNVKMIQGH